MTAEFTLPLRKDYKCENGFSWRLLRCEDIDECTSKILFCGRLQCENTVGSFTCGCKHGFRKVDRECLDIDECTNDISCPDNAACENNEGSFTCSCKERI